MRIRIPLFTLMPIRLSYFDEDANPDPTPHQSNANLAICDHWYTDPERHHFEPPTLRNWDFNADPDPAFDFMWIRIRIRFSL